MTLDTHSEQLMLLRHLGYVAMKVRLLDKPAPRGLFSRSSDDEQARQTIYLLTDAVHNVEGLAGAIEHEDHAEIVFLAQLLLDRYTDPAYSQALADVRYTPQAIDALRAIKAKANAASIEALAQ